MGETPFRNMLWLGALALGRQLADGGSSGGTFSPLAKGETY